jgi:hypothetical protein
MLLLREIFMYRLRYDTLFITLTLINRGHLIVTHRLLVSCLILAFAIILIIIGYMLFAFVVILIDWWMVIHIVVNALESCILMDWICISTWLIDWLAGGKEIMNECKILGHQQQRKRNIPIHIIWCHTWYLFSHGPTRWEKISPPSTLLPSPRASPLSTPSSSPTSSKSASHQP